MIPGIWPRASWVARTQASIRGCWFCGSQLKELISVTRSLPPSMVIIRSSRVWYYVSEHSLTINNASSPVKRQRNGGCSRVTSKCFCIQEEGHGEAQAHGQSKPSIRYLAGGREADRIPRFVGGYDSADLRRGGLFGGSTVRSFQGTPRTTAGHARRELAGDAASSRGSNGICRSRFSEYQSRA